MDSSVAEKRGVRYGSGLYSKPTNQTDKGRVKSSEKVDVEAYLKDPEGYIKDMEEQVKKDNPVETVDISDYYKEFGKKLLKKDKITVTSEHYLDTMTVLENYLEQFKGRNIETTGFVYREEGMPEDQAVIARFSMTCCSADAAVYGTIIEGEQVKKLQTDDWYNVEGIIGKTDYNGQKLPKVGVTKLTKIKPLEDPYVYPSPESMGE
jgi:putative membrane protein